MPCDRGGISDRDFSNGVLGHRHSEIYPRLAWPSSAALLHRHHLLNVLLNVPADCLLRQIMLRAHLQAFALQLIRRCRPGTVSSRLPILTIGRRTAI